MSGGGFPWWRETGKGLRRSQWPLGDGMCVGQRWVQRPGFEPSSATWQLGALG